MDEQYSFAELLANLIEELKKIHQKIDLLTRQNAEFLKKLEPGAESVQQVDVMTMLKLPSSLRKTVMALYGFKKATAGEIAEATGRSRAVESDCANQLARLGLVNKRREGMDVYFSIEPRMEDKK